MSRSAKSTGRPAGPERGSADACDDIEIEFLGIWLGLARLREKVRYLTVRDTSPPHAPRPQA
jgi:hypothetical protein